MRAAALALLAVAAGHKAAAFTPLQGGASRHAQQQPWRESRRESCCTRMASPAATAAAAAARAVAAVVPHSPDQLEAAVAVSTTVGSFLRSALQAMTPTPLELSIATRLCMAAGIGMLIGEHKFVARLLQVLSTSTASDVIMTHFFHLHERRPTHR
jgi:hypothetical protein